MADGLARIRFLGTVLGYTRSSIILVWFHRMPEGKNIWMLRESNEYEKASQDDPQQMKIPENQQMSLGV